MHIRWKGRARLVALVAAASLVLPVFAAGPAAASTGDWGHVNPSMNVPPGSYPTTAELHCVGGGCTWDPTMTFVVTASNGATIDGVGTTSPFVQIGGPTVGSCTVTSTTQVVCTFSGSGTAPVGGTSDYGVLVNFTMPASIPDGAAALTYSYADSAGVNDPNTGNDVFTVYAANTAATPLVSPALLGGIGGAVGLLVVGGYVLYRRRRAAGLQATASSAA